MLIFTLTLFVECVQVQRVYGVELVSFFTQEQGRIWLESFAARVMLTHDWTPCCTDDLAVGGDGTAVGVPRANMLLVPEIFDPPRATRQPIFKWGVNDRCPIPPDWDPNASGCSRSEFKSQRRRMREALHGYTNIDNVVPGFGTMGNARDQLLDDSGVKWPPPVLHQLEVYFDGNMWTGTDVSNQERRGLRDVLLCVIAPVSINSMISSSATQHYRAVFVENNETDFEQLWHSRKAELCKRSGKNKCTIAVFAL